ncbi:TorF family putative porin [Cupriavidus basilensis]|uniref:TorF family putative porin n=1 Tax=Cupriavidus basilensis TaxID=68895 RepID=A0ABT6AX66_9BURK|nr:TorF family putative porin [Cupriavidus basilensis]MDF3837229.1 TorF family putative porin [Cupriavidus basilensis]
MTASRFDAPRASALSLLCATLLSAAPAAFAQSTAQEGGASTDAVAAEASPHTLSANVTLASEYRYRGLMQTNRRPAIQGGFDYSHSSGFYLGNWNSSISWLGDSNAKVSAPVEMDFYGGFKNTFTLGGLEWNYDVGALEYYYPGDYPSGYTRPYTTELYGGIGYGPVFLKYSHAVTNLFGFADSKNSYYVDLSANVPLDFWGLTLNAHVGYQKVKNVTDASYTDWKLGLTKDLGKGFALALAYIDTNANKSVYTNVPGRYIGKATAFASITKTF